MADSREKAGREFVEALISLFSMHYGECFIGSYKHARLILQLRTQRYIPQTYIKRAFDNVIAFNYAARTGKQTKMELIIGELVFKARNHFVYQKVPHTPQETEDIVEALAIAFTDFDSETAELTKREDVDKLRSLQKEKGNWTPDEIRRYFNRRMGHCWGYTDHEILYDVPRENVLAEIEDWERYDPREEERQRKEQERIRAIEEDQWQKAVKALNLEFRFLVNALAKKMAMMINLKQANASLVLVPVGISTFYYGDGYDMKKERTIAVLDDTEASTDESGLLTFKKDGFSVDFWIARLKIDLKKNSVVAFESGLELRFTAKDVDTLPMDAIYPLWQFHLKNLHTDDDERIVGYYNLEIVGPTAHFEQ